MMTAHWSPVVLPAEAEARPDLQRNSLFASLNSFADHGNGIQDILTKRLKDPRVLFISLHRRVWMGGWRGLFGA